MLRPMLILGPSLLLAGCVAAGGPARPSSGATHYSSAGLERVIGQNAQGLTRLLGTPDADVHESVGRKLQFASAICVLDAYLYPPARGRGDAVVTHVDTRQRDGSPIDPGSCVAALIRRDGGR